MWENQPRHWLIFWKGFPRCCHTELFIPDWVGRAALKFATGHATLGLLNCEQFVTGSDCLLQRLHGQKKMNAGCLGHLHSVRHNSGLFTVELHNLIWAKFLLSLPVARYRLSRVLGAPADSGWCCGPGSGVHSLLLSSISTCGAEYVSVKHSAFFVLVFCQNQPSFLAPSLLQCKAAIEMEVSVELVPCPAPALTCHLNHSAYKTFFLPALQFIRL